MIEQELQKEIIDYLRLNGWFVIKNNLGGIPTKRGLVKNQSSGLADLTCLKDGIVIMCEIKTPDGRQSQNQKEFQQEWEEYGGIYFLVHSLDEAIDFFKEV
ncbi:MAG: hypothetical protein PHS93_09075 [Candidatus Omnitrophica bacterium]|nr:hypothetical protein [Candidatus Omnitrophota bacterium]MDD5551289.1 hypothetical protein [Candidatus Omnitrophota bacterium]